MHRMNFSLLHQQLKIENLKVEQKSEGGSICVFVIIFLSEMFQVFGFNFSQVEYVGVT